MTKRKDFAALDARGEISEKAAASILGVCSNTLSAWRRRGFAGQPFAPACRQVHKRLTAYAAAEVQKLRDLRDSVSGFAAA